MVPAALLLERASAEMVLPSLRPRARSPQPKRDFEDMPQRRQNQSSPMIGERTASCLATLAIILQC
jgi:hypothetical protein